MHAAEGGVLGLALAPGDSTLVTHGRDGAVRVWRLRADGLPAGGPDT